jgi:hypothetical protein
MIQAMASLSFFIKKFGRREGRERYNAVHRQYRKTHLEEIRKYRREYMRGWRSRKITAHKAD